MSSYLQQDSASRPPSPAQRAVIRRAGPADAEALAQIGAASFTQSFGHQYPAQDLADFLALHHTKEKALGWLTAPDVAVWLVECDGETVGHALVGPCALPHPEAAPQDPELKRIYLLAKFHGGGLGRRLMDEALAWAQRDGPRRIWIGVWSENARAIALYEGAGFAKVGEYEFVVGRVRDKEFILRRG
ncbi:MAG TPA: GNAT family N-acetyltransferase [Caulobacteraceae bacterium]|jgi:ribosomal protein S18 acetylase RimI-like enzyme|nr:GNAT family N-acetyltransferase [Caulobacteraceae bacterium]